MEIFTDIYDYETGNVYQEYYEEEPAKCYQCEHEHDECDLNTVKNFVKDVDVFVCDDCLFEMQEDCEEHGDFAINLIGEKTYIHEGVKIQPKQELYTILTTALNPGR